MGGNAPPFPSIGTNTQGLRQKGASCGENETVAGESAHRRATEAAARATAGRAKGTVAGRGVTGTWTRRGVLGRGRRRGIRGRLLRSLGRGIPVDQGAQALEARGQIVDTPADLE